MIKNKLVLKIGHRYRIKESAFTRRGLYKSQGRLHEYKENYIDRETDSYIGTIVTIKNLITSLAKGVDYWGVSYEEYRNFAYIEEDGGLWAWSVNDFEERI